MKDNRSKSRSRSKSKDVEEEMQTNNDQQIDENGATRPENEEHQQSGD